MATLPLLVFDVNETLLDLEALTPLFARLFGDGAAMREWFAQVILYSQALSLAGEYVPFGELGGAALKMQAAIHGKDVSDADLQDLSQGVASLPVHPNTVAGLKRLKQAGFRLFTLTNNPAKTAAAQLERAGLTELFERQFSIDDEVRRYKPAVEAYQAVAKALDVPTSQLCLIACHTWDTLGAVAAGCQAALLLRSGNAPLGVGPQPNMVGRDLDAVAEALITRFAA